MKFKHCIFLISLDGAFRFEYASDNGLAAGEMIEPDGSRVGAYQYKDPSGQLVKLKYRAGKDGFQVCIYEIVSILILWLVFIPR